MILPLTGNIDRDTKRITAANPHDSQAFAAVLRDESAGGKDVWAQA